MSRSASPRLHLFPVALMRASVPSARQGGGIHLVAMLGWLFVFSGCNTAPQITVKELREDQAALLNAERENAELRVKAAEGKVELSEKAHQATMTRVQLMANANYEAGLANRRNPQQNNSTYLVDKNTALVAGNSPLVATPQAITEADARVALAEQAQSLPEIDSLYKGKWEEAKAALERELQAKQEYLDYSREQEALLRVKEREVVTKYRAGYDKAVGAAENLAEQISEATQELYAQLVWIFAGAGVIATGLGVWCFYSGNLRMGAYALAGAGFFGVAAFLTVWLQENQWVVWVFGAVGICGLVAVLVVKQGWTLRNNQLVGFAAKRAALVRFVEQDLKMRLQDFGVAAGETLETLDLHEVEFLEEKLLAHAKKEGIQMPSYLKG